MDVNLGQLEALVEKGKELQTILAKNPEVLEMLRLLRETKETPVLMQKADRLILAGEAATILGVNQSTIGKYVKSGKLAAYKTAGSNLRKFWLSQVMALPERMKVGARHE